MSETPDEGRGEYPTYDEWLQQKGLPLSTIPTPVRLRGVDTNYRKYSIKTAKDKMKDSYNQAFNSGREHVYGEYMQGGEDLPIYGPATLDTWFSDWNHLNDASYDMFRRTDTFENVLGAYGYLLGDQIARGDETEFYDNQIWKVSKFVISGEGVQARADMVEYACKIVHLRYFNNLTISKATVRMMKEAKLLLNINHDSIIRVVENIYVDDRKTQFPNLFIASIMELMDGTLCHLIWSTPSWTLDEEQCFWCLKDIGEAIDYLHNRMRSPSGQWMRVVHLAIRAENILFRKWELTNGIVFKLADFEECIIYDENFRTELWDPSQPDSTPPDVLPNYDERPYAHILTAPEIYDAREEGADRTQLRLMPSDVYCLGSAIAFARVTDRSVALARARSTWKMLDRIQAAVPPPPDNSLEFLLKVMTHPNPIQRATIEDVLQLIHLNSEIQF